MSTFVYGDATQDNLSPVNIHIPSKVSLDNKYRTTSSLAWLCPWFEALLLCVPKALSCGEHKSKLNRLCVYLLQPWAAQGGQGTDSSSCCPSAPLSTARA